MTYEAIVKNLTASDFSPCPTWLSEARYSARAQFLAKGFPEPKDEDWKTVDLKSILEGEFNNPSEKVSIDTRRFLAEKKYLEGMEGHQHLFLNDSLCEKLSGPVPRPSQRADAGSLRDSFLKKEGLVKAHLGNFNKAGEHAFSLINFFSFKEGYFLHVPDDVRTEEAFSATFLNMSAEARASLNHPRILVILGKRSKVRLRVRYQAMGEKGTFTNSAAEIYLGEGAELDYCLSSVLGPTDSAIYSHKYFLSKGSTLSQIAFLTGGALSRHEHQVLLTGERTSVSLKGLSILSGKTQTHNHTAVYHQKSHGRSRQTYKTILADEAFSDFNSLVHVAPGADKSDSNQTGRSLFLSDKAKSTSRPKLQIGTDDVACTHGTTAGQLEENELFYLESRGLSRRRAKFLLTEGFAKDMVQSLSSEIDRLELEALTDHALNQVIEKD